MTLIGIEFTCPFDAQMFFNKDNQIDKINVLVKDPNKVNEIQENLANSLGNDYDIWTWKDYSGAFLNALDVERRVMFIILSLVILIVVKYNFWPCYAGKK